MFHKNKACQIFQKQTFLTLWYAHVRLRIRGWEMFVFRKIWHAFFSWNTLFEIRPFPVGKGPGFSSSKVRLFNHLTFLLQPNEKPLFGKYHSRGGLRNTANTQYRAFFAKFNLWKKFSLKEIHLRYRKEPWILLY